MQQEEMKSSNRSSVVIILMIIVFIIGSGLRIANSNLLPLDQTEAALALNSLGLQNEKAEFSQPFYTVITGFLFWLFEDTNFFARLLPVVFGSGLILIPWLLGDVLSTRMKLLLSIGLALDPALMAASKTAGSHIIAVTSLVLLAIFILKKKPIITGVMLAIFFMSGASFIFGLVTIGLASIWTVLRDPNQETIKQTLRDFSWKPFLVAFILCYVFISTGFFVVPAGIGATFQEIANLFQPISWKSVSPGVLGVLVGLLLYEGFPLLFAVLEIGRNRKPTELLTRFFFRAFITGLVVLLVNPGRTALDLVWLSVPLWVLASQQLDHLVEGFREINLLTFAIAAFFLLMTGFILLTYVGAINVDAINVALNYEGAQQKLMIRGMLIVGGILLIGISYVLSAYTWDAHAAKNALLIGVGSYFLVFGLFGQTWHSAFLGANPASEMWHQSASFVDADLISETVEDISEMNHGQRFDQPIMVVGVDSPALNWQLRDQELDFALALTSKDAPEMILTNLIDAQYWGAEYTGQDFRLSSIPNWSWLNLREWLSWMLYHKVEVTTDEMVILWVRTDLFPGQAGN